MNTCSHHTRAPLQIILTVLPHDVSDMIMLVDREEIRQEEEQTSLFCSASKFHGCASSVWRERRGESSRAFMRHSIPTNNWKSHRHTVIKCGEGGVKLVSKRGSYG